MRKCLDVFLYRHALVHSTVPTSNVFDCESSFDGSSWFARDSDATDQKLRSWIIEEFDNVNSKLDTTARSDLGASISFFKEGVVFLNKAMDICQPSADTSTLALSAQMGSEGKKMVSPLKETELLL